MSSASGARTPSRAATSIVTSVGRLDYWVASTEKGATVVLLLVIVAMVFLQAVLRFVAAWLPLGEWLDPFRFTLPPDAVVGTGERAALALRKGAATVYDLIVRGGGEVSRYALVWTAVLGASVATRERRHIAVDALTRIVERRASGGGRAALWAGVLVTTITALVAAYLAFAGWVLYQSAPIQMRESAALRIPIRWVAVALPIGFAMMTLRFLGTAASGTLAALGLVEPAARYAGSGGLQELLRSSRQEDADP